MKNSLLIAMLLLSAHFAQSQINIEDRVKRKMEDRANRKIDEAIDKTLDKTEEGVKDAAKGDGKNKKGKSESNSNDEQTESESSSSSEDAKEGNQSIASTNLKAYSKYDFVAGEKIIVQDDFSNVAVGDFPADWNTNSGGEIVTVEGKEGKWLMFPKEGVYMPDYIDKLPENFTLQFDLMCNEDFNYYSGALAFTFLPTANRGRLNDFDRFSAPGNGVRVSVHPRDAGSGAGSVTFRNFDSDNREILSNAVSTQEFFVNNNTYTHVSIWRQKQRLRVYLNEEKVLDVPRAFDAAAIYNAFSICFEGKHQDQDRFLLTNLNMAVGAPDTRSNLITEGKLVTRGILFDSGSDKIKPESYGTLKDIAGVLKENPDVKVKIIGHTDSDGDDAKNLELSKKRSAAVKQALEKEFSIDASRLQTDGKGESEPTDKNDTTVGKANNRRVEFVKL